MKNILLVFFLFAIVIISCYYDSEENLYPVITNNCDTTSVTFAGSIAPLLQNNCLTCHSNNNAASQGGNIRLQNYADIYTKKTVILASINRMTGALPMPKGTAKLNICLIRQAEIWINNGAPNN